MKKTVLFVKHLDSSFIRRDEELLSQEHRLKVFHLKQNKGWRIIPALIRQFFFMLWWIPQSHVVYIWFADFHAIIPVLLGRIARRKVVVVIGGVDASYLPEFQYGTKTRILGRLSVHISTRLATHLLPVSHFTKNSLLTHISPQLDAKSQVIYNCFDAPHFTTKIENRTEIITVCLANRVNTLFIKGVDFFAEVARAAPEHSFTIVGLHGEAFEFVMKNRPDNLKVINPIPHPELQQLFLKSKIVCQFSRHEAFGLALLEGISMGCFPVGYDFGGTAEILKGTQNTLIHDLDVVQAAECIRQGMKSEFEKIEAIQRQVLPRFSCSIRKARLEQVIQGV